MNWLTIDIDNLSDFVFLAGISSSAIFVDVQNPGSDKLFIPAPQAPFPLVFTHTVKNSEWKSVFPSTTMFIEATLEN